MSATTAPLATAQAIYVAADCPHCRFNLNYVPAGTTPADWQRAHGDGLDIEHLQRAAAGVEDEVSVDGFVTTCESCGHRFLIPNDLIRDVQHLALRLLGEVD